jgi:hypothetical protein
MVARCTTRSARRCTSCKKRTTTPDLAGATTPDRSKSRAPGFAARGTILAVDPRAASCGRRIPMKTVWACALALAVAATLGCSTDRENVADERDGAGERVDDPLRADADTGDDVALGRQDDADNTGRNERDREDATLTPMDQGESEADLELTRRIRQAIVGDDALSVNAHNVKIIAANGVVTLRGPVENAQEEVAIVAKAREIAGTSARVDNQLEVVSR